MERREFLRKGLVLGAGLVPGIGLANESLGGSTQSMGAILPATVDYSIVMQAKEEGTGQTILVTQCKFPDPEEYHREMEQKEIEGEKCIRQLVEDCFDIMGVTPEEREAFKNISFREVGRIVAFLNNLLIKYPMKN